MSTVQIAMEARQALNNEDWGADPEVPEAMVRSVYWGSVFSRTPVAATTTS